MPSNPRAMKAHPLANLFPLLPDDESSALASDIKKNGLREPITIYQGMILDGRNRYRACRKARVTPAFKEYKGEDPIPFIVSKNLARRHLSDSQRALLAVQFLPQIEAEAKARMLSGKHPREKVSQGRSTEIAAKLLKTNSKYVSDAENRC